MYLYALYQFFQDLCLPVISLMPFLSLFYRYLFLLVIGYTFLLLCKAGSFYLGSRHCECYTVEYWVLSGIFLNPLYRILDFALASEKLSENLSIFTLTLQALFRWTQDSLLFWGQFNLITKVGPQCLVHCEISLFLLVRTQTTPSVNSRLFYILFFWCAFPQVLENFTPHVFTWV